MQKVMTFHTSSTIIKFWMSCCTFRHFLPVEISHLGNITCRKWYFGVNAAANRAVQWFLLFLFHSMTKCEYFSDCLCMYYTYSAYPEMWFQKQQRSPGFFFLWFCRRVFSSHGNPHWYRSISCLHWYCRLLLYDCAKCKHNFRRKKFFNLHT